MIGMCRYYILNKIDIYKTINYYSPNSKGSSLMWKLLRPDLIFSCQSNTTILLLYNKLEHIVLQ